MTINNPTNLFGFLSQDIARLLSQTFEQQTGELNISRVQARVLAYIAFYEGATQTTIAALMDVQKITLTKLADDLEHMNLIERRPDSSDRRVRRLYMAKDAGPVLDQIWERLSDVSAIALAPLSNARSKALIQDLIIVRDHLTQISAVEPAKKVTL
jgi:MarR family transcriptional regulator for hemolysin